MTLKWLLQGTMFAASAWAGMGMAQPTTPVSPELAALQDLYARIEIQRKILDEQRAMLKSNIGEGVTLPSGKIERAADSVLPSAIHVVSYDALRSLAAGICADIASTPPPNENHKWPVPFVALVSNRDLRDLRDMRFAIVGHLRGIQERVRRSSAALAKIPPPQPGKPPALEPREMGAILLGLDAIGAVGKAIAGLAGFFKTERQIGMLKDVVDDEVLLLALRTCDPKNIRIVDALAVEMSETDFSEKSRYLKEVNDLRIAAEELRPNLDGRSAEASPIVKQAIAALAVADTAIEKLSTVDEKTGVSPMVTLARMGKINELLEGTYQTAPVVSVKVRHSSGYSQINKTWWRSDKLDFAAGLAVSFSVANLGGRVLHSNMHYVHTPWYRLQEEHGKFSGAARSLRAP